MHTAHITKIICYLEHFWTHVSFLYLYEYLLYFVWVRSKGKCTFISILYTSKAQVCCICPSSSKCSPSSGNPLAKYSTLGQVTSTLPFASITIVGLEACCMPLYHHFASRRRHFGIYCHYPTTIAVVVAGHYYLLPLTVGKSLV